MSPRVKTTPPSGPAADHRSWPPYATPRSTSSGSAAAPTSPPLTATSATSQRPSSTPSPLPEWPTNTQVHQRLHDFAAALGTGRRSKAAVTRTNGLSAVLTCVDAAEGRAYEAQSVAVGDHVRSASHTYPTGRLEDHRHAPACFSDESTAAPPIRPQAWCADHARLTPASPELTWPHPSAR